MMNVTGKKFARLLTEGIHRVRLRELKTVQIVQDELGYALGREGGSAIEYWRKGHIPANLDEVELLAKALTKRGGLSKEWLEKFLKSAEHPHWHTLCNELFPTVSVSSTPKPTMLPTMLNENQGGVVGKSDISKVLIHTLPPFMAGPPISHPYQFFGRERNLKRLFNLWKRPPLQNAAIIGPKRSGKTSLLHYLKNITLVPKQNLRPEQRNDWLPYPQQYQWLFVDFQDVRLGTRDGLLKHLLTGLGLSVPESCGLDYFLDVVSRSLRTPTLILFDEIGVALERYPELDDPFWESLRSLATNQVEGNLGFVLSSHEAPSQLAWQSDLGSPFFNIFGYSTTLGPLSETEARSLIASSPIQFLEDDVKWIMEQSQCWPILLQILCQERLFTLEEGETDNAWQADGLAQIEPFNYLLT